MKSRSRHNRGGLRWIAVAPWLVGCHGAQSALDPAGPAARHIATLFWWMTAAAVLVWVIMVALTIYSVHAPVERRSRHRATWWIIGGGAVVPTVALTALLAFGLAALPELVAPAPEGSLRVMVSGEQWWWRVRYPRPGGAAVEMANEIHIPVGEPIDFRLESADVIHSFWIPSLGGKLDMFPGRVTRLALTATRIGPLRGVCAEYCGASHAYMSFDVVVEGRASFERWLAHQAEPARTPASPLAAQGQTVFLASGCGSCHTLRGTASDGVIGPDLTHVGSRRSLAALTLPNDPAAFSRWIAHTDTVKPGALMPDFGMLPRDDLRALAAYLEGLQ